MNTINMIIEAKENGMSYENQDMLYSHKLGFVSRYYSTPWEGKSFKNLNDLIHDDGEFSEGWIIKKVELTNEEKIILKAIINNEDCDYRYITRDDEDYLELFDEKPEMTALGWDAEVNNQENIDIFSHIFKSITLENSPLLISDLLD